MPTEDQIVPLLLAAYRDGAFPMADPDTGRMDWYCPDPRALMPLEPEAVDATTKAHGFHISRSLARRLRANSFRMSTDAAFEQVVRECAEPRPGRDSTWIDERILRWYTALHHRGHAHSIEAWAPEGSTLLGGIYGVSIGAAFFAESMFSRPELGGTDASKVCLVQLVNHLRARGYTLMDVQFRNPHIDQFGVYTVRRRKYLALLADAVEKQVEWGSLSCEA